MYGTMPEIFASANIDNENEKQLFLMNKSISLERFNYAAFFTNHKIYAMSS